ncbi:MAG: hypothetical protein KIS94_06710 [Chitinophagales bacterium]|nr:hypothetical protein [Chitinophagales bacterium]
MNLLFDFLQHLPQPELSKLQSLSFKGTTGGVFKAMLQQSATGKFEREKIQKQFALSNSHFDKLTSELLSKCYKALYPEEGLPLLGFLSTRVVFNKHYYKELARQLRKLEQSGNKAALIELCKGCINHIHFNFPIMYKDSKVMQRLGRQYIAAVPQKQKAEVKFWVQCRVIYNQTDNLFAAAQMHVQGKKVFSAIEKLGKPQNIKSHELLFEYYWVLLYYYMAMENFPKGIEIAQEAIARLQKLPHENAALNILRFELKLSELFYFSSRFEESYTKYHSVFTGAAANIIPERGYHTAKYLQICFITGHLNDAKKILNNLLKFYGDKLEETIPVREIFSFIKYYLFAGDYDNAFRFLQLGFRKNPKGKYFQYEIELRNLQVALFYLTGRQEMALQMCERNIKYLRSHGYSVKESNYPYFYILTRAIFEQRTSGRKFKPIEEEKMQRYLRGSFGVYGQLLLKMQACKLP